MQYMTVKIKKQFRRFLPPGIYNIAPGLAKAIIKNGFAEETDEALGSPAEVQARYDKIAEEAAAEKKKKAAEKKKAQRKKAAEKKEAEEKNKVEKKAGPTQAKTVGPSKNQKTGPSKTTKKKEPAKKTK